MRVTSGPPGLDLQVDSYAAAVKPAAGTARFTRWSVYAAATGSALAMATSAEAGIITGGSNVSVQAPRITNSSTLVNGVAANFYPLGALGLAALFSSSVLGSRGLVGMSGHSGARVLRTSYGNLRRLNAGAVISTSAGTWGLNGTVAANCGCGLLGSFNSQQTGFAAFRLAGQHFGWIRLKWESSLHDGIPDKITAFDWAYQDAAGVPIRAGEVPEPGAGAMALLAAGAAGIAAWRKRRRAHAEAVPAQE